MIVKFPDLNSAANKLQTNGQSAQKEYVAKAGAAAADWHANTSAAEGTYVRGVNDAIARGAFGKGVNQAGPQAYSGAIAGDAGARFSSGISKAGGKWSKGFGAIASKVSGTDIGPRGITGSPENKQRAANMADAFRAARLATLG
jgi:hypothetical protein